jgi:hypothetical protein
MWKLCPHFPDTGIESVVITWIFTSRTRPVKVDLADTTNIVFWQVPAPGSDRIPLLDGDLHGVLPLYLYKEEVDILGLRKRLSAKAKVRRVQGLKH